MRRMGVQEYEEGELKPAVHFPAFICAISIIQIVIFLNFDEKYMISILGNNPDRRSELWRFFTTSFVHNSHNHLWHNLVMQLYLGALIELYHGWKRVSAIYVSSVLGGSALSTVLEPHVYSAGASAGILGLATANILDFILNYEVVKLRTLRAVFMITFVYHSILLGLYREYNYKGEFKIDYISHAGGLCAGISASFLYLKYEYLSETLHLMLFFCAPKVSHNYSTMHSIYPGGEDPDVINEFIEMDRFGNPVPPRSPRRPRRPSPTPSSSTQKARWLSHALSTVRNLAESLSSGRALYTFAPHSDYMKRLIRQRGKRDVHYPVFMCAISIIQIVIFLFFDEKYMISILGTNPDRRSEVWRYFTASLVHNSHNHLWHNLAMQVIVGVIIEYYHGWKRVTAIYVLSVLAGSALSTIQPNVYSAGASAGIMGLAATHIMDALINSSMVQKRGLRFVFMVIFVEHTAVLYIYRQNHYKEEFKIDHISHVGGFCVGLTVSFVFLKKAFGTAGMELMRNTMLVLTCVYFALLLLINYALSEAKQKKEYIVTQDGEEILEDPYREFRHSSLEL
ncbi:Protein rhomboid [Pseudolycoriella hygida]|uniref:Protein rhomboid n=1 Tax=Pseudolycoriella hygida TaxID=35572 RepID=A0A9Q0S0M0_9DIPT|nr:Protein rhomboid [Pseudolycoriella hygida]